MPVYADTSFLAAIYTPEPASVQALGIMQQLSEPLPFTPFHRHELRNGIRLRVFRREITAMQRQEAFAEIEADLKGEILSHTPIPWTETFRRAEDLASAHTETLGVRSFDILHVGLALTLRATEFLTFDKRQAALAHAAGLKVRPQ